MATYAISTATEVQNINNGHLLDDCYLAQDIDCSGISNFVPIGIPTPFEGTFNGNGYKIKNLNINDSNLLYGGLFGYIKSYALTTPGVITIQNVIIENCTISSGRSDGGVVGGLIGYVEVDNTQGAAPTLVVDKCAVIGDISSLGAIVAGGLIGEILYTTGTHPSPNPSISKSFFVGTVGGSPISSSASIAGFIGAIAGPTVDGFSLDISDCFARATVSGSNFKNAGGFVPSLVALDNDGSPWFPFNISRSYFAGSISGIDSATAFSSDGQCASFDCFSAVTSIYASYAAHFTIDSGSAFGGNANNKRLSTESYDEVTKSSVAADSTLRGACSTNDPFTVWDFASVWKELIAGNTSSGVDEYPVLQWMPYGFVLPQSNTTFFGCNF